MRKSLKSILALSLALVLSLGCVAGVSAASSEEYINEVTDVVVADGYTVSFGEEAVEGAYSNIEKLTLSFTGVEGTEYVVFLLNGENNLVPANGNIRYIDQRSGETTMEFTIYPDDMTAPGDYAVHIATGSDYIENVVTFKVVYDPPYTLGDVNGSGDVEIRDAVAVLKYCANIDVPEFVSVASDTNKNGKIDVGDAVAILKYCANLIPSF